MTGYNDAGLAGFFVGMATLTKMTQIKYTEYAFDSRLCMLGIMNPMLCHTNGNSQQLTQS